MAGRFPNTPKSFRVKDDKTKDRKEDQSPQPNFVLSPQQRIDEYEVIEQIGAGGMGAVYKVRDVKLKRLTALKFVLQGGGNALQRFYREMELSAKLSHPNIVKIYRVGEINQIPYLAMEYIDGVTLLKYIEEKHPSLYQQLVILEKISLALEYAHEKKIIHRDIKPSNIMMRADGEPVLMDFGLAKTTEVSDHSLTRSGEVVGTPQYMSPEQAQGLKRQISVQTDIYSLGAVLYQLLTGTPPFNGDTTIEILHRILSKRPARPRSINPEISKSLENIALKALEKNKKKRYHRAKDFAVDLRFYYEGKKTAADSFYRMQFLLKIASCLLGVVLVSVLLFAGFSLYQNYIFNVATSQEALKSQIQDCYAKAKSTQNVEDLYIELSRLRELLEEMNRNLHSKKNGTAEQTRFYKTWKTNLEYAWIESDYKQGNAKIGENAEEEAVIYLSRALERLEKLDNEKAQTDKAWKEKISLALINTYFRIENHKMVYQIAMENPQILQDIEIAWIVAQSGYYCSEEDAAYRFAQIQKKTTEQDIKHIGSLYYQGVIAYDNQNIEICRDFFTRAMELSERTQQTADFTHKLYLYYCAAMLVNLNTSPPDSIWEKLWNYLRQIEPTQKENSLYKQTLARFYLVQAQKKAMNYPDWQAISAVPQELEDLGKKAVSLMEDCIQEDTEKADYYYLRGKGHIFTGDYRRAAKDFVTSSDLDKSKAEPFMEQLQLFSVYADPDEVRNYDTQMLKHASQVMELKICPFSQEFQELRRDTMRIKFSASRGIPFSQEHFERCVKNYASRSQELSGFAEITISSMIPHERVLDALAKKIQETKAKEKEALEKIRQQVEQRMLRKRERDYLIRLSRVPFTGIILDSTLEEFKNNAEFLKQILLDTEAKLCPGNKKLWIFMRFLAARVMVYIRDLSWRKYLLDILKDNALDISTKIIVARSLCEIDIVLFDRKFIWENEKGFEDEFLNFMMIESLRPFDEKSLSLLARFCHSPSERVRVMAVTQITKGRMIFNPDQCLKILAESHQSKNPSTRALAIMTLWSYELYDIYFRIHTDKIKPFYPLLIDALQDESEIVQRSAFTPLPYLENHYSLDYTVVIPIIRGIQERSKSSLMVYQSIMALGNLGDISSLLTIGFNPKCRFFERISTFLSIGWKVKPRSQEETQKIFSGFLKILKEDPNKEVRGYVLYAMIRYFEEFKLLGAIPEKLFWSGVSQHVSQSLDDENPGYRFFGVLTANFLSLVSDSIIKRLYKTWKTFPRRHIRMVALSTLLHISYRKKLPELEKLHDFVKHGLKEYSEEDAKLCRMTSAFGYNQIIRRETECDPRSAYRMDWNTFEIEEYELNKLKRYARTPENRASYIDCLERILDILNSAPNPDENEKKDIQDYIYQLAVLCNISDKKKAWKLLNEAMERYSHNPRIVSLWMEMQIENGDSSKLLNRQKEILEKITPLESGPVMRTFAKIYLAQKDYKKAEDLYYQHYILNPRGSYGLFTLGDYYCQIHNYEKAIDIFRNGRYIFPYNYDFVIGEARAYAGIGNIAQAINILESKRSKRAYSYLLFTSENIKDYPEFEKIAQNRRINEEHKEWFKD